MAGKNAIEVICKVCDLQGNDAEIHITGEESGLRYECRTCGSKRFIPFGNKE